MLVILTSCTLSGYDGLLTQVEVDVSRGLPHFDIVGLADTSVKESRERVRAALVNNGFRLPGGRITVNLAPAAVRKHGPVLDLPIALGILLASQQLPLRDELKNLAVCGELSLEGKIKGIRGVLPMAITARSRGVGGFLVPAENAAEAGVVKDLTVHPLESLSQVVGWCQGTLELPGFFPGREGVEPTASGHDLSLVRGQEMAKRALEIAAAGGHNLLMLGPPGSGKTMLANCLPTIMPPLNYEQTLSVSKVYSIAGLLPRGRLVTIPPFRSPHHSASLAGIVGGGSVPRPGEISLAHHGILYLDEFPEFRREVIEVLRQPMEEGKITLSRAQASHSFPSRFLLVASANPCPCGFYGVEGRTCQCLPSQVQKYRSKFSGPILDRIDLWVEVGAVEFGHLQSQDPEESSAAVRERVIKARHLQQQRFQGVNGQMDVRQVYQYCRLDREGTLMLERVFRRMPFSARSYQRILKVSRTIADLEGLPQITLPCLAEALSYRTLFGEGSDVYE